MVAELEPGNPQVSNQIDRGAWATKGHMDVAIQDYAEAVRIRPDNNPIRTNYANALAAVHRMDEAVAQCAEAVRMSNNDPDVLFNYADLLYQDGRRDEAIQKLREVLRLKPSFGQARQTLDEMLRSETG